MRQLDTGPRWGLGLLVALGLLGMAGEARAQSLDTGQGAEAIGPRTFGTSATISHTVHALAFVATAGTMTTDSGMTGSGARFCSPNICTLIGPVSLPAGAVVTAIELEACDDSSTTSVRARLFQVPKLGGNGVELASAATPLAGPVGCTVVTGNATVLHTIDNFDNGYVLLVSGLAAGASTLLQAVRVLYTLQVSPAPAIATFVDVPPSHPFFQFIEALVASGITSGCGGGNFCPEAALTRGQMAVFLSRGLGLHFAP